MSTRCALGLLAMVSGSRPAGQGVRVRVMALGFGSSEQGFRIRAFKVREGSGLGLGSEAQGLRVRVFRLRSSGSGLEMRLFGLWP